ncbi:MAG TPA: hypothetical protein VMI11_11350 [Actinomycetes bacterium]|nr:hypothetical protein [Actinomycetes bacterium]
MKLLSHRTLGAVIALGLIAFVSSGLLRNATHGVGAVLGDIAWFTFLICVLATLALSVALIAAAGLRRRRTAA